MAELLPKRSPFLRLTLIVPVLIFAALAALFYVRLDQLRDHPQSASDIPSALIGKHVPLVSLPALEGAQRPAFSSADLSAGHVSLVNIFGSWCEPCRDEHPVLMRLSRDEQLKALGVEIIGLAYKDEPKNALAFLTSNGNPYDRIGVDGAGRAAIEWGAYGVPESFLVRGDGTIARKFIGQLTNVDFEKDLRAALVAAAEGSSPQR
jgi:cytochrome c biogenesis protein CcmG/thiol:disulfide interchange protein DsbE